MLELLALVDDTEDDELLDNELLLVSLLDTLLLDELLEKLMHTNASELLELLRLFELALPSLLATPAR